MILKKVKSIPNPFEGDNQDKDQPSWTGSGYTKLYIWTLIEYELVFYIDADAIIQSITVLEGFIEMLIHPEALLAAAPDVFPPDNFNAGILLIRPNMNTFRNMLT